MGSSTMRSRGGRASVIVLLVLLLGFTLLVASGESAQGVTKLQYYVQARTTGAGGYCNPSAAIVNRNDSFSTDIVTDDHVRIQKIYDNGRSMPIKDPYVIPKVQCPHDIQVVLQTITYTVNASVSGGHGRVSPPTQTVVESGSAAIDITPDPGYHIVSIVDNGMSQPVTDPYVVDYIYEDHNVVVTFTGQWTVNASGSSAHGAVIPVMQKVVDGGTATMNLVPATHYEVASIIDNGESQPLVNPYVIAGVSENHWVVVSFDIKRNTVNASVSGGHGTVAPPTQVVDDGKTAAIDLTPDVGYHIGTITDNGAAMPVADPYIIDNVTEDHNVVVTYAINQYAISAAVEGGHGIAAPVSPTVDYGDTAVISITPDPGYVIATIVDNGESQPIASPYQIPSVAADHHVVITFKAADYMVHAVAAGEHGTVSPTTQSVTLHGNAQPIVITPDAGYHIATVTDNGVPQAAASPYQLDDVTADHAVVATFAADSYHVTAQVGSPGGTVDPADQLVSLGGTAVVNIHPATGFHVEQIIDDGESVTVASPYVINNVREEHDVTVVFDVNDYDVDASVAGGNGTVAPPTQTVSYGGCATIDITADPGYHLTTLTDNGESVTPTDPYVIDDVKADHTVVATFTTNQYGVYASVASGHGSVNPEVQIVASGGTAVVNTVADTGYHVDYIEDNGVLMPIANPYVITDVTIQHNVSVGFAINELTTNAVVAGGHGTAVPREQSVIYGDAAVIDLEPVEGYHASSIIDNGRSMPVSNPYIIDDVTADHNVTVSFAYNVSPTFYLAEGSTAHGFSTYISIENPNAETLGAEITYMLDDGSTKGQRVSLPPLSQVTVDPRAVLGDDDFSTKVTCLQGKTIAVDRTMTWTGPGAPSPEAHSSVGVAAPATTWYLPEGCSAYGFETWTLIENPNDAQTPVSLTYMIEGKGPVTFERTLPAHSRTTYSMEADIGKASASLEVGASLPVIAERAMYRNDRREGSDSVGTDLASDSFYLAEGSTAWGFTTYVLVQNPNSTRATVRLTCMTPGGPVDLAPFTMEPGTRSTLLMNSLLPDTDFSTVVRADMPVAAERAMYWGAGAPLGEACHDSIGLDEPHATVYLPDGQSSDGRETYTLVSNPNSSEVEVMVSYLYSDGTGASYFTAKIAAGSRVTFNMAERLPSGRAAIMVTCLTSGKQIMAERSMYWNSRGAGTNSVGAWAH